MKTNLLIIMVFFVSGLTFAGERTITLGCGGPIDQEDGESLIGGGSNVKVILNTDFPIQVVIERYAVVPNPVIHSTPTTVKGFMKNYFKSDGGTKVYLFRDSNCLKGTITAILINEEEISNCTYIKDDKMVGNDYDFCK